MEEDLRKMLDTIYEAEALLEMALRRKEAGLSDKVKHLVADKCLKLFDITNSWNLTNEAVAENEPLYTLEEGTDKKTELEESSMKETEDDTTADEPELDENDMLDIMAVATEVSNNESETDDITNDTDIFVDDIDENEEQEATNKNKHENSFNVKPAVKQQSVRTPILSFFTINDRYRLRRSLFNNDSRRFDEALATIESLDTLEQAAKYMEKDLKLDSENTDVNLFTRIVERYFASFTNRTTDNVR